MWVLIVISIAAVYNPGKSIAVETSQVVMQEFTRKEHCEEAAATIKLRGARVHTACVQK